VIAVAVEMKGFRAPMVRRNKFILGSPRTPVKDILVQCTRAVTPHCRKTPKCNKMKYLRRATLVPAQPRTRIV